LINDLPINFHEVLLTLVFFNGLVLVVGPTTANAERRLSELLAEQETLKIPKAKSLFLKSALVILFLGMGAWASSYFLLFVLQRGWIFERTPTPAGIIVLTIVLSLASLGYAVWRTAVRRDRMRRNVAYLTELYEFADRFVAALAYVAAILALLSLGLSLLGATLYSAYG